MYSRRPDSHLYIRVWPVKLSFIVVFCCTARILFLPTAGLPHPTTPNTAMDQRGDRMSNEDSRLVETFSLPGDQHQGWFPPRLCILLSFIIFSFSVLFRLSYKVLRVDKNGRLE